MTKYLIQEAASFRLDEIYSYTFNKWGKEQADRYITEMFEVFECITDKKVLWRPIPAEFDVDGYFTKYISHFIYWKILKSGKIGIVTILHERMHQISRFKGDFFYMQKEK